MVFGNYRPIGVPRFRSIAITKFNAILCAIFATISPHGGEAQAQTNLYWNNTSSTIGNWGRTLGGGNWQSAPSGGTLTSATTLNDIANFNSNTAFAGTHDVFTGAGQAAYGLVFGVGSGAAGPFRIRANTNTTFDRTFTLGTGGITVNAGVQGVSFSNTDTVGTPTGNLNVVLQANQSWTNHSTSPIDFSARLIGSQNINLTKSGSGTLILSGDNRVAVSGTTTGFGGRIVVNQGTLIVRSVNALGSFDSKYDPNINPTLVSDTVVTSGGTLDISGTAIRDEIITISGSGVNGNGAIVNSGAATATVGNLRLAGNANIGGSSNWTVGSTGSIFTTPSRTISLNGFNLTKLGTSIVSVINTSFTGGGDVLVNEGGLTFGQATTFSGNGAVRVASGASLSFNQPSNLSMPIVLAGNNQILNGAGTSNISSNVTLNGSTTINLQTSTSTLNLTGATSGSGSIFLTGASIGSRLSIGLDGSNYTGSLISVDNATLDLRNVGAITANIQLNQTGGQAAGIRGEGQTSGNLSFNGNSLLTFDPTTTGTNGHLRVGSVSRLGSTPVQVEWTSRINGVTGVVVLESSANDIVSNNYVLKDIRGSLNSSGSQLTFNHDIADLRWRGNAGTNPTIWDKQAAANWLNTTTSNGDIFYDGDAPVFDDSVGSGSRLVNLATSVSPSSLRFDNSAADYTITPTTTTGRVDAIAATLTKTGTGTVTLNTIQNGTGHRFSSTNVQAGVLEIGYVGGGPGVSTTLGTTTVSSGAVLRDVGTLETSSFSGTVTVNSGGLVEVIRSATPSSGTSRTILSSLTSGTGDVVLRGVVASSTVDSFGDYSLSSDGGDFGGTVTLDRARLNVSAFASTARTKFVVPSGSQFFGSASNSTFEIAGTGADNSTSSVGASGALRINQAIPASSSIVLTSDARISGAGRISAPISGTGSLEFGIPNMTGIFNEGLSISGSNSYSGSTTIQNTTVIAENNSSFSTGSILIKGDSANSTALAVERGTTISNNIFVSTTSGINGGGVIRGGPISATPGVAGMITGAITFEGSMAAANRAHFGQSRDSGSIGSYGSLIIAGPINIADPSTQPITYFDSGFPGSRPVMEFRGGGGNYTKFELRRGDIRLGANNGLNSGIELITNTNSTVANDTASLDMNGFDQTVSRINKRGNISSNFTVLNRGTRESTLTIQGDGDSEINHLPFSAGGAAINIVKNGSGALTLNGYGYTDDLNNPGLYTINGGAFSFPTPIHGSLVLNGGVVTGKGTILGNSRILAGGLSPGESPGTLTFGSDLTVSGNTYYNWELMSLAGGSNQFTDTVVVGGALDLTSLNQMDINVIGLADYAPGQVSINAFDPSLNYQWTLFDTTQSILGFDTNDFVINTTAFSNNNPFGGSFFIGLANGNTDVVLNYSAIAVPEPSTSILLVSGLGLLWFRYRRSSSVTKTRSEFVNATEQAS